MQKTQLAMYIEHQNDLIKSHENKIIAVKDGECLGSFDSLVDASRKMMDLGLKAGEYLIIRCTPGDSEYTAFFANFWQSQGAHA